MVDFVSLMVAIRLTRRNFLAQGALATLAAGSSSLLADARPFNDLPMPAAHGPLDEQLDAYIGCTCQA